MSVAAPTPPRRRLGQLMVDAGLLSEAQVERALAVQAETGRQLGQVLVDLGFASPAAVGNALASQEGRALKTEYGFALGLAGARGSEPALPPLSPPTTGFRQASPPPPAASPPPPPPPPAPATVPAPPPVAPPVPPQPAAEPERREPGLAEQAAALERRAEELVGAVRRIAELEVKAARLETELEEARRGATDPAELEQLHDELGRLRRDGDSLRDQLEQERARTRDALRERDEALARAAELEAERPPTRSHTSGEHTLLVPAGDAYKLVRRKGAPPPVGERVEIGRTGDEPARTLLVARVAAPPGGAPCAYLADL